MSENERPSMVLYRGFTPAWKAGSHTLRAQLDAKTAQETLLQAPPGEIHLVVEGSAVDLPPGEVLACFPSPGVPDASPFVMPSVLLRRRTLPWERSPGAGAWADTPWLAVITLLDDAEGQPAEYTRQVGPPPRPTAGVPSATLCSQITVADGLLLQVLPRRSELGMLCHARHILSENKEIQRDDDGFVAVVMGAALPTPTRRQTAFLVSLEGLMDHPRIWPNDPTGPQTGWGQVGGTPPTTTLVVLHAWSFTATAEAGGDFEAVMQGLDVARFGVEAPEGTALPWHGPDGVTEPALYRGPLHAFPTGLPKYSGTFVPGGDGETAARADDAWWVGPTGTLDMSRPAAFELGRLLALSSPELLNAVAQLRQAEREPKRRLGLKPEWLQPPSPVARPKPSPLDFLGDSLDSLRAQVGGRLAGPETDPVRLGARKQIALGAPGLLFKVAREHDAPTLLRSHLDATLGALVDAVTRPGRPV